MTSKNLSSLSFAYAINNQNLVQYFEFSNNPSKFYLNIEPKHSLPSLKESLVVYLRRVSPYEKDIHVLCTISIVDQNGQKVRTQASKMLFVKNKNQPDDGGVYFITRDYLTNSGLVIDGKLTFYSEVEILDEENNLTLVKLSKGDQKIKFPSVHKKALDNYQAPLDNAKFSDVVFVIGKKEFKLHKIVLSAQSPVFATMFDSDLEETKQNRVEITDVDVSVFEALIRFIYTANVDLVQQYALDLFVAADKYQLDSLKDICAHSLGSNLTIETVANIFLVAYMHNAEQLKSNCVQYINANASKVMATEGWKLLMKDNKSSELLHELYRDIVAKTETFLQ